MLNPNIEQILSTLHGAALVAATKYVGSEDIRKLYEKGIHSIGENRVQDMLKKQSELADLPLFWHFIGHLQSNKVPLMINRIVCLHSLDSEKLAAAIQKHRNTPLDCFVEVNVSQETSKNGIRPEELQAFVETLAKYDTIRVIGLMGMGPLSSDPDATRQAFRTLRELRDGIRDRHFPHAPATELSMGMSGDYRMALEEGSTCVRLGSILFRSED